MKSFPIRRYLPIVASFALAVFPLSGGAAEPGTAGASTAAPAKSPLSAAEKKFVKDAGEAQLAILHLTALTPRPEQPGSEALKEFNKKLAKEIEPAWGELSTAGKGTELPKTDVTTSEKTTLEKLKKTDPDKFDKAFLKAFSKESKKAAQVFEMGEKGIKDPELKSFAQKYGPVLKKAYDEAEKMEAEAGKKK